MAEQAVAEVLLNRWWPQSYRKTANSWLIRPGWNADEWNAISWINGRWVVEAGVADNADDNFMFWYCGLNRMEATCTDTRKELKKIKTTTLQWKAWIQARNHHACFSLIQVKSEKNHKKKRAKFTNENKLKKYFWSNIVYLHFEKKLLALKISCIILDGNQVSWGVFCISAAVNRDLLNECPASDIWMPPLSWLTLRINLGCTDQ